MGRHCEFLAAVDIVCTARENVSTVILFILIRDMCNKKTYDFFRDGAA